MNKKPKCCPLCGSTYLLLIVDWYAHSLDDCDLMNNCIIEEYECCDCGISFWV